MKKVIGFFRKELMLTLALIAAAASLFISPPDVSLIGRIDWRTLGTLFLMLCVLEGFKKENVLSPLSRLSARFKSMTSLSLFLIFGVFFTSMFVTNDVSLIIFVPITITLFRNAGKEKYILPVISLENIAAIRGSLLMPFGSPQNLFLYGQADISVWRFMLHMSPLCAMSAVLLVVFVLFVFRKEKGKDHRLSGEAADGDIPGDRRRKIVYILLFVLVTAVIVTRTRYWYAALVAVIAAVLMTDRKLLLKVDYVLLATFLCFFAFSSSIASSAAIAPFLKKAVAGYEYFWAIGLSQLISNVPATIVLYPFSKNFAGLIYGADTAGLCSLIGSLASVINYRLYVREYPGGGSRFIKVFTLTGWAFFAFVAIPGYFLCRWDFFS